MAQPKKRTNESKAIPEKQTASKKGKVANASPAPAQVEAPVQNEVAANPPVENVIDYGGKAPVLTQQIITAKFNRELTLIKFQSSLQSLIDWKVTEENVPESQSKTKEARGLITKLKDIKSKLKKPALDECDMWENAFKSVLSPLEEALKNKDKELQDISNKIAEANRLKQKEKERVDNINKEIDNFILEQSKKIAEATTPAQLVAIEKLIGSHKANSSRYMEFLPKLVERCNELTPMIKTQKDLIKSLADIEEQKKTAEKDGDDRALLELQEKGEAITDSIEEKKIQVQETAIYQATRPDEVVTPEPVMTAIKPRRRSWSFDIVDEKKAYLAGMLICDLNKEKVKQKLEEIKGTMKGKEIVVDGIKYSYVETY